MKTGPARFVSYVRIEPGYIRKESDDFDVVLGASPVYGETTVEVYKIGKLWICLRDL